MGGKVRTLKIVMQEQFHSSQVFLLPSKCAASRHLKYVLVAEISRF